MFGLNLVYLLQQNNTDCPMQYHSPTCGRRIALFIWLSIWRTDSVRYSTPRTGCLLAIFLGSSVASDSSVHVPVCVRVQVPVEGGFWLELVE